MTREIALTKNKVALVDDEDFEQLNQLNWCATKAGRTFYAVRQVRHRLVFMHRTILSAPEGFLVDHRDGDGLNNTRANLRIASKSQNMANTPGYANNKSGFKGVSWSTTHKLWRAYIRANGNGKHLGYFKELEDAARAYNAAASELFGEYARPNSI